MNLMKRVFFLLALCLPFGLHAQDNGLVMPSVDPAADSVAIACMRARMDSIRRTEGRPTVAVVLAGGGARGMAHLGVLKYMEELGLPVDMIGGTSMGGLVSGLYSMGYDADYLDSLVRAIDWSVMMSDKVPDSYSTYKRRHDKERFGIFLPFHYEQEDRVTKLQREKSVKKALSKTETRTSDISEEAVMKARMEMPDGYLFGFNVRNTLSSVSVGYQDSICFRELPIPFFCVATDMVSMKAKNWTSGSLVDAMRSTMAIPFYFRPVRTEGQVLSDGGTRNNFPVDLARAMGADIVIGSEMPVHRDASELNSLGALAMQNISMMSSDAANQTRNMVDVLLEHELPGYNMLSFDDESVSNIIRMGYEQALEHKEEFLAIADKIGKRYPHNPQHPARDIAKGPVKIRELRIEGVTVEEQKWLLRPFRFMQSPFFGKKEIDAVISHLYGSRAFESVTWRLEGAEEPYTLIFDCQKGQVNEIGANVHIDNDERVSVGAFVGLGTRRLSGWRFQAETKLGTNTVLNLEGGFKPLKRMPSIGMAWKTVYQDYTYWYDGLDSKINAVHSKIDLFVEDSQMTFGRFRMGLSVLTEPYEEFFDLTVMWKGWDLRSHWESAFAQFRLDTFNDGYFPTQGYRLDLNARYVFSGYSVYMDSKESDEILEGKVPPYFTGMGSFSFARTYGDFTFRPMFYAGWTSQEHGKMAVPHSLGVGGIMEGRYLDNQIPFFGFPTGVRVYDDIVCTAQLDLRYRINHKNYATLRAGLFQNAQTVATVFGVPSAYAFGAEYGRKTIVGPLMVGLEWCDLTGFGLHFSFGFNF